MFDKEIMYNRINIYRKIIRKWEHTVSIGDRQTINDLEMLQNDDRRWNYA